MSKLIISYTFDKNIKANMIKWIWFIFFIFISPKSIFQFPSTWDLKSCWCYTAEDLFIILLLILYVFSPCKKNSVIIEQHYIVDSRMHIFVVYDGIKARDKRAFIMGYFLQVLWLKHIKQEGGMWWEVPLMWGPIM